MHQRAHVLHRAAHDAVHAERQDGAFRAVRVDQVVAAAPQPVLHEQVLARLARFVVTLFLFFFKPLAIFFFYQVAPLLLVFVILPRAVSVTIADGVLGNASAVVALECHVYVALTETVLLV